MQAPAALVFVGITALFVGLLPRAAIALGWGLYGILIGFGLFGGLLDLPEGVERSARSPTCPRCPPTTGVPTIMLGAIAVVARGARRCGAFRRRDLTT